MKIISLQNKSTTTGSSLTVGKAANTGAVIGTEGTGVVKIGEYTGKDLNNYDTMRTTGGSIGLQTGNVPLSNIGYSQESRDKEGISRNTVVGNVEIGTSTGRSTNEYFQDKYKEDDINISIQSDGKDYSNVDFGEHVGNDINFLHGEGPFGNINGISGLLEFIDFPDIYTPKILLIQVFLNRMVMAYMKINMV